MKLKKIASLALAGVMAVSMLTACQTTSNNENNNNQNPNVPVVTDGVSADVKARIEANGVVVPEYVTFADSNKLDNALSYATQFAGIPEVLKGNIFVNEMLVAVTNNNLVTELDEAVGVTSNKGVNDTIVMIGDNDTLISVEMDAGQKVTLPDAVAVQAYVISNEIGDDARNELIARAIQDIVSDYQYTVSEDMIPEATAPNNYVGGNFTYEYEVSVSTCDVTRSTSIIAGTGSENPDVTFVAVQVVRTATHQ